MEKAVVTSQHPHIAEQTAAQKTIEKLTQEIASARKDSDDKAKELRNAQRQLNYLKADRDKLQAKCDSMSRLLGQREADYANLQFKLGEVEEHLNKTSRAKNMAISKSLQDQSHALAKEDQIRALTRELTGMTALYHGTQTKLNQREYPERSSKKRNVHELYHNASQDNKVVATRRVVQCVQCYTRKWPCDAEPTCRACTARGQECRRVKCQFWTKGSCSKAKCGLAHEGDGYSLLLEHRKLKQRAAPMPDEVARELQTLQVFNSEGAESLKTSTGGGSHLGCAMPESNADPCNHSVEEDSNKHCAKRMKQDDQDEDETKKPGKKGT